MKMESKQQLQRWFNRSSNKTEYLHKNLLKNLKNSSLQKLPVWSNKKMEKISLELLEWYDQMSN